MDSYTRMDWTLAAIAAAGLAGCALSHEPAGRGDVPGDPAGTGSGAGLLDVEARATAIGCAAELVPTLVEHFFDARARTLRVVVHATVPAGTAQARVNPADGSVVVFYEPADWAGACDDPFRNVVQFDVDLSDVTLPPAGSVQVTLADGDAPDFANVICAPQPARWDSSYVRELAPVTRASYEVTAERVIPGGGTVRAASVGIDVQVDTPESCTQVSVGVQSATAQTVVFAIVAHEGPEAGCGETGTRLVPRTVRDYLQDGAGVWYVTREPSVALLSAAPAERLP